MCIRDRVNVIRCKNPRCITTVEPSLDQVFRLTDRARRIYRCICLLYTSIIGAMMDKTSTRFGKFRPFIVLGSAIMAVSILALYCLTPLIPETTMWLCYVAFTLIYAVWVIGTRSRPASPARVRPC